MNTVLTVLALLCFSCSSYSIHIEHPLYVRCNDGGIVIVDEKHGFPKRCMVMDPVSYDSIASKYDSDIYTVETPEEENTMIRMYRMLNNKTTILKRDLIFTYKNINSSRCVDNVNVSTIYRYYINSNISPDDPNNNKTKVTFKLNYINDLQTRIKVTRIKSNQLYIVNMVDNHKCYSGAGRLTNYGILFFSITYFLTSLFLSLI